MGKISGKPGIEPGTAGYEARTQPLCYAVPPLIDKFYIPSQLFLLLQLRVFHRPQRRDEGDEPTLRRPEVSRGSRAHFRHSGIYETVAHAVEHLATDVEALGSNPVGCSYCHLVLGKVNGLLT